MIAAQYRTRKSFLRGGPALHLFVVTLAVITPAIVRFHGRAAKTRFDMGEQTAKLAVDRLFEAPSEH